MINLIPKEEKKKMIKDFHCRLAAVFVIMLDFGILVALFSILPSYFISSVKNSSVSAKMETPKLDLPSSSEKDSLALAKDINNELILVDQFKENKFLLSVNVINAILLKKSPDIKITQILYENNKIKGKKISLVGTASSREVLLSFRKALEDDLAFKDIALPISNFVKESDINFSISLNFR